MSHMYRGGPPGMQGRMAGGPLQRARLALNNGQPALAEEICRRELQKKENDVMTRLLLTQALVQMQRAKEAVAEARTVIDAQPKNVDALMLLASALVQTNQMNPPKEAQEVAERAVSLQPRAAKTHIQLAEVLLSRRDFDRAKAEAETATQLEPRLAAAHLIRGMALLELKDYEGALQASQSAIRFDNTLAVGYIGKARALTEMKRTDEALTAINEAERMNPNLPAAQMVQLRSQVFSKQRKYWSSYKIWLDFARRSGGNRFLAPIAAFIQFLTTIFGQAGVFVLLAIVAIILFGIAKIPLVGGWLLDALIIGIGGFGAWNAVRTLTGRPAPQVLANPTTAFMAIGTIVLALAVVFGIDAAITHAVLHGKVSGLYWFTPLSLGLGALVALIGSTAVVRFFSGSVR